MKFNILTFFTEGPPHDTGTNLVAAEQEFQIATKDHADKYLAYSPRKLTALDPAFEICCRDYTSWLEQHPDRNQLGNYKPNWARIGFQMWKPFLVQHVLNSSQVQMGDIVLYHDVDCHTYPTYILNCEQWKNISSRILNELKCDIFIPAEGTLERDVKAYLIRKYLGEDYFRRSSLWNGLMVMRKSEKLLQFLEEWVDMSSELENISPLPNPEPRPDFHWHSVDQSVLGILAWIWVSKGLLPKGWPYYKVNHRHFSKENLVLLRGKFLYKKILRRTLSRFQTLLRR